MRSAAAGQKATVEQRIVQRHREGNTEVVVYDADDDVRYTLVVTRLTESAALAPMGYFTPVALVSLPNWPGCPTAVVTVDELHPVQLEVPLHMGEIEAELVAELLAHVLGVELVTPTPTKPAGT